MLPTSHYYALSTYPGLLPEQEGFKEFRLNLLNELTAMQHVAASQRRKASVVSCMDTESSTSAVKSMKRALAND